MSKSGDREKWCEIGRTPDQIGRVGQSALLILHFQLSFQALFARAEETCRGRSIFNPHALREVSSDVDRPVQYRTYFLNVPLDMIFPLLSI